MLKKLLSPYSLQCFLKLKECYKKYKQAIYTTASVSQGQTGGLTCGDKPTDRPMDGLRKKLNWNYQHNWKMLIWNIEQNK